jgi:opacity protein-like surface antigen
MLLAAGPQAAAASDWSFKLYGMLARVSPLSESEQDVGGVVDAVEASSELGYNFGIEFKGSLLGIELDYLYAEHEISHETAGLLGDVAFQPISATLNLHFPLGMFELYGGPTAAYVNWGDLELGSGDDLEIEPEFAFGLSAGVDFGITKNLAATGGLRWLNVSAQPEDGGGEELEVDPLFVRFGIAARY